MVRPQKLFIIGMCRRPFIKVKFKPEYVRVEKICNRNSFLQDHVEVVLEHVRRHVGVLVSDEVADYL